MENGGDLVPICPPPWDAPNDVLPMLAVLACFLILGWVFRRWRRNRRSRHSGK